MKDHSDDKLKWETVEERIIFRNKYLGLRNDKVLRPDGKNAEYVVVENRNFVSVVCLTNEGKIILVRQFRYPWKAFSWELPSGIIEQNEPPESAAIREIKEETGFDIKELSFLKKCHPFAIANGWSYLFFAILEDSKPDTLKLDEGEFLYAQHFHPREVMNYIKSDEILHAPSIMAFYIALVEEYIQL